MSQLVNERAYALAAIALAAELVDQLARFGKCDEDSYELLVKSIFSHSADNVQAVYGGRDAIRPGALALSATLFEDQRDQRRNVALYAMGLMTLQKRLLKRSEFMALIDQRLKDVERQIASFGYNHPTINAAIAQLYTETVSQLGFRLQVVGDAQILQRNEIADRIRTVLFAGIRAVTLWRNLGGRRYQLLFAKGAIKKSIAPLL